MLAARLSICPRFDLVLYKRVFSYTGNLTLFQFINYFHRNLDNLLIGRFLGAVQLGFYTRAYSLLNLFNTSLSGVITPVLHAAMAKKQDDLVALRRAYGQVLELILWISAPFMAILAAFSPEVIRLVWGPGWGSAEQPFFWLAIAGMHQSVYGTIGTVFAVRYKTKELILCGTITTVLYGLAIIWGVRYDIASVSKFYSLTSIGLFFPLMIYVWNGLLAGEIRGLIIKITQPLFAGGALLISLINLDNLGVWTDFRDRPALTFYDLISILCLILVPLLAVRKIYKITRVYDLS
jgi:PST family polysaccharide transporter